MSVVYSYTHFIMYSFEFVTKFSSYVYINFEIFVNLLLTFLVFFITHFYSLLQPSPRAKRIMPVYKNYTIQKRMWVLIFYDGNAILFTPSKRV
jgi:hypothetical protein